MEDLRLCSAIFKAGDQRRAKGYDGRLIIMQNGSVNLFTIREAKRRALRSG